MAGLINVRYALRTLKDLHDAVLDVAHHVPNSEEYMQLLIAMGRTAVVLSDVMDVDPTVFDD